MTYQKNDTLFAFKAIALSPSLNGTDKQVAVFIVDSFNIKTKRCDPSVDTASVILGKSKRTILRAIDRLVKLKFLRKLRHGGHNHCNKYEPNWTYFRELELKYKLRRKVHAERFSRQKLSPSVCQPCHSSGVNVGTQTYPTNNFQLTCPTDSPRHPNSSLVPSGLSNGSSHYVSRAPIQPARQSKSIEAAQAAAVRRWSKDLHDQFGSNPIYGDMIDEIDEKLQDAATEAEMKRAGGGIAWIVKELDARQVARRASGGSEPAPAKPA
jgi:hypothetical protein